LEGVGAVMAYRMAQHRWGAHAPNRNLLWALWGALRGIDWRQVPDEVKARLIEEAEG
jgi:hypothetical protein